MGGGGGTGLRGIQLSTNYDTPSLEAAVLSNPWDI